jgi:hypothetical protein
MLTTWHYLALDVLVRYAQDNMLAVNIDKTKVMVFSRTGKFRPPVPFNVLGKQLETVASFIYLGITFAANLRFNSAISDSLLKSRRALGILSAEFGSWDKIPLQCIRMLYNAFIPSVFSYGAELWGSSVTESDYKKFNPDMKLIKSTLKLPLATSHDLLRREFFLYPLKFSAILAATRQYLKMESAPATSLLYRAHTFLNTRPKPDKRNFIKRTNYLLYDMKLDIILTDLPDAIKLEQCRLRFFEFVKNKAHSNIASKLEYEQCSYLLAVPPFDCALDYFSLFDRPLAKTLLLIRTNSLYKPFQYIMKPFSCIYCQFSPAPNSGWAMVKHHCLECPAWNNGFLELRKLPDSWKALCQVLTMPSSDSMMLKLVLNRLSSIRRKYASTEFNT